MRPWKARDNSTRSSSLGRRAFRFARIINIRWHMPQTPACRKGGAHARHKRQTSRGRGGGSPSPLDAAPPASGGSSAASSPSPCPAGPSSASGCAAAIALRAIRARHCLQPPWTPGG
eukprot:11387528-Alexandrium_andersonii.AAC.1